MSIDDQSPYTGLIATETGWKLDEDDENIRSPFSGLAKGAETLYL